MADGFDVFVHEAPFIVGVDLKFFDAGVQARFDAALDAADAGK